MAALLMTASLVLVSCGSKPAPGSSATTTSPTSAPSTSTTATTVGPTTTLAAPDAGSWALIADSPYPTAAEPAAWTGRELLVAQVGCCGELGSVDLAAFEPATGVWRKLPATPLSRRSGALGAWTGQEMVVVGGLAGPSGVDVDASPARDGAAWVRSSDSWHRISDLPTSIPTIPTWGSRTAVWTGSEVLVWASQPGASRPTSSLGKGSEVVAAYNPTTDHWRSLPASGLTPRQGAVIVWTGSELVVWGGHGLDYSQVFADGARLDPATGTWRRLPSAPVPARGEAASVWDGHEVLLWGGRTGYTTEVGQGAAYSPSTDQWRALPLSPLRAKSDPAGVWTGRFFLVVGGVAGGTFPVPGPGAAAYDPASNSWTALPAAPAFPKVPYGPTWSADQRAGAVAAWTGSSALFVGGLDYQRQGPRPDGLMWSPAT